MLDSLRDRIAPLDGRLPFGVDTPMSELNRERPVADESTAPGQPSTVSGDSLGSVTHWIDQLKQGDNEAAGPLWDRYFGRIVALARTRLASGPARAVADEEDAAISAFQSLCQGASDGRFERLRDRQDLWKLLVVLTARKAVDLTRRETRLKRGGGRLVHEAAGAIESGEDGSAPRERSPIDQAVAEEPTPEFAALLAEEFQTRLDQLQRLDPTLRTVALAKLEGYAHDEIADRLGCVTRTVERKLDLIRKLWSQDPEPDPRT